MLGHGTPQGHTEMHHGAGTLGREPARWMGRLDCWLAAQLGGLSPLEGLAVL